MTTFTFNGPNGQTKTIDAPTREDAIRQLNSGIANPPAVGQPGHPLQKTDPAPQDFGSTGANLAAGAAQGLLNPVEGAAQLAEHLPYVGGVVRSVIPQGLRDWAKNFQSRAESTTAGRVGEFAGNVAPFLFQPELGVARAASAAPYLGRTLGFLGRLAERGTLPASLEPVPEQPKPSGKMVAPDDFWTQKLHQAEVGTAVGAPFEAVASGLGALTGRRVAQQQATQQAAQSAAAQHAAAVAAHQTGTLARAAEQQAAQQAKAVKEGIPKETTLRWYKETLDRIGLGDQAPTAVTPEAGARVQKLVGDRLNDIIGRMQLDHNDPAFTERLSTIRDEVMHELPESAQNKFYKVPPEEPESPLLVDQYGRPFSRRTRTGEPPKPSGDWVKTVIEPLEKGELKGRALTDYISRLGARAEELARSARTVPQDQRAEMYAMSNAYRQVEDAVIGHAAGSPEDKLALEQARKAYSMWSIGNDAGRAAQGGAMTPQQLIRTLSRRMGEARYKQALADAKHPDSALYNWVQRQQERLAEKPPPVRPASAVPRHPGKLATPNAPPEGQLGQHAANALAHMALWHAPGVGHAAYWFGRPFVHALTRRAGPAISRAGNRLGRAARWVEAPVSAGSANVVKQSTEPAMKFEWPQ